MESVIPCEPNGSGDSLLSSTDLQQAVAYRDFCYNDVTEAMNVVETNLPSSPR